LGYTPLRDLKFSLVGAYIDAKLTTDAPGIGGLNGDQLPSTPKWSTSLDGEYTWQAASNVRAFVGGTYSYVGERYSYFSSEPFLNPHTLMPSYQTLNLRAGIVWDGVTVQLLVQNATDERGLTSYSNSGAPNLAGTAGIIQPRTFALVLAKRF
jgi:outer membrane receptor protein involved in Fe transport